MKPDTYEMLQEVARTLPAKNAALVGALTQASEKAREVLELISPLYEKITDERIKVQIQRVVLPFPSGVEVNDVREACTVLENFFRQQVKLSRPVTDRVRLSRAFHALRKKGYKASTSLSAKQLYGFDKWCCLNARTRDIFTAKGEHCYKYDDGFSYVSWHGDAREIIVALEAEGFQTKWDGGKYDAVGFKGKGSGTESA